MKTPLPGEYYAIVVAAMVLLVVLVACYISVQLYQFKKGDGNGASGSPAQEGFLAPTFYYPSCRTDFLNNTRANCHGFTSGVSSSIDSDSRDGGWLCPGLLGVPP